MIIPLCFIIGVGESHRNANAFIRLIMWVTKSGVILVKLVVYTITLGHHAIKRLLERTY